MKARSEFSEAASQSIMAQLAAAAGVDPRALDASRLRWVVDARCRQLKIADAESYVQRLQTSAEELDELIDAIVVQETRFFRDAAVFEHLRRWLPELAAEHPGELRVLSAPCSTGQEAYSLAAVFQLAGIALERVSIDAFDISAAGLATAERGIYPEDALKRLDVDAQQACGELHRKQWKMHDALRRRIRFERRNLAEPEALAGERPYHLILCRNLFIYLRPEARAALAGSLAAALAPGGRLVLGSADRVEEVSAMFSPIRPAAAFAFTHRAAAAVAATAPVVHRPSAATRYRAAAATVYKPARAAEVTAEAALTSAEGLYRRALDHQQHGELRRAERRCRQALYLDPKFMPALELLEKLWGQHPNVRLRRALEARILRHRAGVEELGPPSGPWMETA